MAHFVNEDGIKGFIEDGTIVNGDVRNAEGVKYDFSSSNDFLKASFGKPIDYSELTTTEKSKMVVDSGEVVFLLSRETIRLPKDVYVMLIPKRKLSHEGIQVMGGFSVDPGYKGRLLIGLYNIGGQPFQLMPNRKLIGASFYRLGENEIPKNVYTGKELISFPSDLIKMMSTYQPVRLADVNEKISNLDAKIEAVNGELRDQTRWFSEFKSTLDITKQRIDEVIGGLAQESALRKSLEERHSNTSNDISNLKDRVQEVLTGIATIKNGKEINYKTWMIIFAIIASIAGIFAVVQYLT